MQHQAAGAEHGDDAIRFDLLGGKQRGELTHRQRCDQYQQQYHADPTDADIPRVITALIVAVADKICADRVTLDERIQPEQAKKPQQHQWAEGEAIAKGFFHSCQSLLRSNVRDRGSKFQTYALRR